MTSPIAQQIDLRMKAHNLSIMELESQASLKPHGVRNILMGKSKNPSAVKLQAIADVLGCTVKELLTPLEMGKTEPVTSSIEENLEEEYKAGSMLMSDCVKMVDGLIQKTDKSVTNGQFLTCIREVYLQSLTSASSKANKEFAEWFVNLL